MSNQMSDEKPLDPEAERALRRVRRLMMIASVTTFVAVGAVLAIIGYRVSSIEERPPAAAAGKLIEAVATLPAGARVVSTALSDSRILVTVEVDGATELLTFDPATLQPLGRLRLESKP